MSNRAEQRALEAYPNESFVSEEYADMCRSFFIEGYEQAEKDLALTWEDVQLLDFYAMECQVEESKGRKFNSSQEFFEEVLRRFNAIKEDMK